MVDNHGYLAHPNDTSESVEVRILLKMPGYESMVNERDDDEVIIPTGQLVGHNTPLGTQDAYPSGEESYSEGHISSDWNLW